MKKAWTVFLSTLSVALAVAIGVGSSGFTNWHVTEWFNHWGNGEETQKPPQGDDEPSVLGTLGGGMVMSAGTSEAGAPVLAGYAIEREAYAENGIAAQSDSAYTVTATVAPDNEATNTGIIWALSWKDAGAEWASGKTVTDYVTAVPSGEGYAESKTVRVTCIQSFGEPIILTAACRYALDVTATMQLDYKARFNLLQPGFTNENFPLNVDAEGTPANIGFGHNSGERDSEVTLELNSAYDLNGRCHSLYPMSLEYEVLGAYTLTNSYQFTFKAEALDTNEYGGIKLSDNQTNAYKLQLQNHELGEREVGSDVENGKGVIRFTEADYTTSDMDFETFPLETTLRLSSTGGILNSLQRYEMQMGSNGMTPKYYSVADDYSDYNSLLQDFNRVKSTRYNGRIPLCKLTLYVIPTDKPEGVVSSTDWEYTTDVYITKIIKSTKITGVTLDQGAIKI